VVRASGDPRLRCFVNPTNLGPQANWNRCLELAQGRYVKLLPHDDLLHPDCLRQQVQVLDDDPGENVALVCSARDVIGPTGRVLLRARGFPGAGPGLLSRPEVVRQCLRRGTNLIGEPGAVLFRRDLSRRVGGFDMRHPYVIDLEYWLRLLEHGQAWYVPQPLASFRVWQGSWSVAIGLEQAADFQGLMREIESRGPLSTTVLDRAMGRITPRLNSLARQVFYKLFV
jgi:glycosyltransferase involved in cell wall biosynthesis